MAMETVNFTYRVNDGQEKTGTADVSVRNEEHQPYEKWLKDVLLHAVLRAIASLEPDLIFKTTGNGALGRKLPLSPHNEIEYFALEVEGFPCLLSSEPSFKTYTCPTAFPKLMGDKPARG